MELTTVDELIKHLQSFDKDKILIVDVNGNTFHPTTDDINLWNPEDKDSSLAIMTFDWF